MERLILNLLSPQVQHAQDPLQFAYQAKVGWRMQSFDKGGGTVRILFLDFSSPFNTIQPLVLQDKLARMQVDPHLVTWIIDYLTGRPQYVRLKDI